MFGLAALFLALVACTSSDSTVEPTDEPVVPPTALAAASPDPSPTKEAAATPVPTPEPEHPAPFLGTPLPDLPDDPTDLMRATIGGNIAAVARKMVASGDQSYIPVLLEFLRFQTGGEPTSSIAAFLNKILEGPDAVIIPPERVDWNWWIEWLGRNPQIQPPKGYDAWKGELFSIIEPGLGSFLYEGVKTEIRLEEVVWGGVGKDGIPDLINPPVVSASEADYLGPDDRVFGVTINGESRAYPLRVLNLHEMANDVLGGVPFALAY